MTVSQRSGALRFSFLSFLDARSCRAFTFCVFSTLGGPGRHQEPGRRPQAAGIHFRREARRASCRWRDRTACPGLTGGGVTRARENVIIPPAPPWFFQLLVEDGGNAVRGALNGKGRGVTPRPEGSADSVRAAQSVQVCPFGPTCRGRPLFPLRESTGVVGRDFQMVKAELRFNALESLCLQVLSFLNALAGFCLQRNDRFSALWSPPFFLSVFSRRSVMPCFYFLRFFNARGPRATSGARPTTASSRNSLPA